MTQERRFGLSPEQKADIWGRWKTSEPLHEIGRAFDKDHGSIQFLLAKHGGIAPATTEERRSKAVQAPSYRRGGAPRDGVRLEIAPDLPPFAPIWIAASLQVPYLRLR